MSIFAVFGSIYRTAPSVFFHLIRNAPFSVPVWFSTCDRKSYRNQMLD